MAMTMKSVLTSILLIFLFIAGAAMAHDAHTEARALELSSPLVTKGRPFAVSLLVENASEGLAESGQEPSLVAVEGGDLSALGPAATQPPRFVPVRPGQTAYWVWDNLIASSVGDWVLCCDAPGSEQALGFHVFDEEPVTLPERPEQPRVDILLNSPIRAVLENEWSRLSFVWEEHGDGYAIAEVWNGARWQRAGSLYPLARLVVETDGVPEELGLRIGSVRTEENRFYISAQGVSASGEAWPVNMAYSLQPDAPRFRIDYNAGAPRPTRLCAFHGPTILAGDRSFGARKQFALFPKVGPLGAEDASPRRVLPEQDITRPLMAMHGDDTLIALLWPHMHEWRQEERGTSALFHIPKPDSPIAYCRMALFVPPVGADMSASQGKSNRPVALAKLERVWLTAWLVLEHGARCDEGPAVDHWSQVYGPR
jgi:hypothetical protein